VHRDDGPDRGLAGVDPATARRMTRSFFVAAGSRVERPPHIGDEPFFGVVAGLRVHASLGRWPEAPSHCAARRRRWRAPCAADARTAPPRLPTRRRCDL